MKNISNTTAESTNQNPPSEVQTARGQLGLGFNGIPACERPTYRRRQQLRSRAAWWFQQMRRAVDSAVEWRPAPQARPEQGSLDLRRPTEVTVR